MWLGCPALRDCVDEVLDDAGGSSHLCSVTECETVMGAGFCGCRGLRGRSAG